ncbi:MAG TPA: hypothetical protein VF469_18775 [Kofleriaceae bacterium]
MFTRSARWNLGLSALLVLAMGACGSAGGCGSCSAVQPLPGGKLPADQTVEGGAQLRVTPHGMATITSIVKPLLDQQVAGGFCLPSGSALAGTVSFCEINQGGCTNGCRVVPTLSSVTLGAHPTDPTLLRAHLAASASATVPLHVLVGTCNINVSISQLVADIDIALNIDPASGELAIRGNPITNFSFSDSFGTDGNLACQAITGLAGLIDDLAHSSVVDFVSGLLSPAIDNTINTLVPKPLGLVGVMNVGSLLPGLSSNQALLETRLVPGGYAHTKNGGLSLGVIMGINADRDPSTRGSGLASEPALCVPPLAAPNLAVAPRNLPRTTRSTYQLDLASQFDGAPDPPGDLALGISGTALDLAGHHLVTSGALCLGVGTSFVKQLNVGTIGLFVRSLGQLESATHNDPLLLVTRPQRALDFTIGDNTAGSPALTIGIEHLEVDFYAFLYERYVRAFTLDLSLHAGVNLEFEQAPGQPVKIRPTLVGIDSSHVQIKVLNSEFVKETPAELEAVLPSVFDLVTPLLGSLPEITVPSFAGFGLTNLSIQHVKSSQDDFLAIYASLGASSLSQLAAAAPRVSGPIGVIAVPDAPPPSTGRARLVGVTTPEVAAVRSALLHEQGGAMPRVAFDVDRRDAAGRELEWTYQLDGGMWRPWRSDAPLVIEDPAFAWQGKYTIGLKSRVKGDYRTVSDPIEVPVIIDSVAPRVAVDQAAWSGDTFRIPAFDIVSGQALSYAFGVPGDPAPRSAWTPGGMIELSRAAAGDYADGSGQVAVFVRDEAGNTAIALVAPLPGDGGGCNAGGGRGAGGLLVLGIGLALGVRRRGVRHSVIGGAVWVGISAATAMLPGCSCGHAAATSACETMADCSQASCDPGALSFCVDHACTCSADIIAGRIGPYSDVAVGADGAIWVSAYAEDHGDLVVARTTGGRIPDEAWEWVDGVPAGPVLIPSSKIRGGIDDNGPDVGMYTSIAVAPDGVPMVSYFDRDTASLKLAQRIKGAWQTHIVDMGTGKLGTTGALAGMYTSLTVRSDDGRPGIAYLAHVADGAGRRAEVRFASAQTPHPTTAADWQFWVVDTGPLPPDDPTNPAMFPLPDGLGLFIDSARLPNQAPVVAYYDRGSGDLKLARFNPQAGQFARAQVLDGSGGVDAGWSPSVAVDAQGVACVAYVGTSADDLKFVTDAPGAVPEVIDDGYRIDGQTVDGLPRPVFHFVGNDAGLMLPPGGLPMVVYQDATTQELLLGQKQDNGKWTHVSIAGATQPWPGAYGFYAAGAVGNGRVVMSSWVVDLPAGSDANKSWVEVFTRPLGAQ